MKLIEFNEKYFDSLIENIDSPLEMMVWAGPKYQYPLTIDQITDRINQTINGKKKNHLFTLFDDTECQPIGYIEIEIIDNGKKFGSIQSVMIYKAFRGKKYSERLLELACHYAFESLKLKTLELKVFSFNNAAVSCYLKAGFAEKERIDNIDPKTGKSFQLIVMKKEK